MTEQHPTATGADPTLGPDGTDTVDTAPPMPAKPSPSAFVAALEHTSGLGGFEASLEHTPNTSAFIASLEQDRVDFYVDYKIERGIAENAFERGWDAHRARERQQAQQILDLLDGLHENDGMPHAQYTALHELVSGLGA